MPEQNGSNVINRLTLEVGGGNPRFTLLVHTLISICGSEKSLNFDVIKPNLNVTDMQNLKQCLLEVRQMYFILSESAGDL